MICLAVNTATTILSVALLDGDKVLSFFSTPETRDQGNLILKHMGKALTDNGLEYDNIDLLGVVTGPGSFTGIRIGLATMRAIAFAAGKPLAGISSFDMFANSDDHNIVAVESWREELYFKASGQEAVNLSPQDFVKTLDKKPYRVTGDAAAKLKPFLPDALYVDNLADARDVARIAMTRGAGSGKPVPFYLRGADITIGGGNRKIET